MDNPILLTQPFANNGERNDIPNTQLQEGDGKFSQSKGFPGETAIPLINGGKPPTREDMNGAFYMLSSILFLLQKGKVFEYDEYQDYYKESLVTDNGIVYYCIKDMPMGTVKPSMDVAHTYWMTLSDKIYSELATGKKIQYSDIQGVPTKVSQFENDADYQNNEQVTATATTIATNKVAELDNQLADVAKSGSYTDLKNVPTKVSQFENDKKYQNDVEVDTAIHSQVDPINAKISEQASATNKLIDKAYVDDSIQMHAAHPRGNWETWGDVPSNANGYPPDDKGNKKPTQNDYMVVNDATGYEATRKGAWYFVYSGEWDTKKKNGWVPLFRVNEEPFTPAQNNAINSGITGELVGQITTNKNNIELKANKSELADVATSGKYTDLTDTPTNVSEFENDKGYQTEADVELKIADKVDRTELETVATSGKYGDLKEIPESFAPPVATKTVLGGVKQGDGVLIAGDGTLKVDVSSLVNAIDWTQLNTSEKLFNDGESGDIDLSNGRVHITSAEEISMPTPPENCATWVTLICTSGKVTFTSGNVIYEMGGPIIGSGTAIYTLGGFGTGAWYCTFNGFFPKG